MVADPPGTPGKASGWVVGHIKSRVTHPELTWEPSNWRVEHRRCSDASGQAAVIEKARADALREAGSPRAATSRQSPPLPAHTHAQTGAPDVVVPEHMTWSHYATVAPEWMAPLLDVPDDAAPPLAISPPHPRAVGSYGPDAVAWLEANLRERGRPLRLRWWQKLALYLQLEHDDAGDLVWFEVLETTPRRAGKSTRLRASALWRLQFGPTLFEPDQIVMHTGRDLAICREIIRKAWPWAEGRGGDGWDTKRGMTEPEVSKDESNRWVVRSKDSTTGYDTCLGLVDESWDVPASAVDEDLEPSMLERESPQLLLTSTAHRRATSLMRGRITKALAAAPGAVTRTLLLWWGAPPGADPGDEATWRAASPYWSPERHELIAAKYAAALAGEVDPEADDLDPMAGFEAQYLNVWRLRAPARSVGEPIVDADTWAALAAERPARAPDVVAVESWFSHGVAVAASWRLQDGRVLVSVSDHPTMDAAAAHAAALGSRRPVLVGASLLKHAAWEGVGTDAAQGTTLVCVRELDRALGAGELVHDGGEVLTNQVLAVRTSPGADGPRLRSTARADAVKAAVWAASATPARTTGMVVPKRFRRSA
ncbi:HNH endonuclease [Sphaerisporangium cinnabarinum]|nr:HNH endonuclease [Sphaerisporangium cinnabarinum]PTU57591.1 HNH endonuclease [Sphaerisporangium cinnabarinum]